MPDALAEFQRLIGAMSAKEKAVLDLELQREAALAFLPNPGPQTDAYLSQADILLFGGSAGGGKSALLIGTAVNDHHRAIIFRRESVELDGLIDYAAQVIGDRATYNGQEHNFTFSGADRRVRFGGMKEPDSWRKYAGRARDFMGFDEAGEFLEEQVSSIVAWNRSAVPGQRTRIIMASNPPRGAEGQWLIEWFAPWLDPLFRNPAKPGELRWAIMVAGKTRWVDGPGEHEVDGETYLALSRTFVPSRLADNPFNNTPEYRARLSSLPEPLRSQLLYGDFLAGKEDHARQVIPTAWIEAAQKRWKPDGNKGLTMYSLGVDVAQGGADNTVLAPLYGTWFGELVKRKGVDTTNGFAVAALIVENRRDKCNVVIDLSGGWGGSARDQLQGMGTSVHGVVFGSGSEETTADGQLRFANKRSELWWRFREALDVNAGHGVALPPDRQLLAQLAAPTWDLRGDRILIESKDEIRKRLGSSTDDADAIIMAWHQRTPQKTFAMPKKDYSGYV